LNHESKIVDADTLYPPKRHQPVLFRLIDPAQGMPQLFDRLKSRQE
jgi:hypothetical protein